MSGMNDTICAISTPLSEGAISIVRLSGSEAVAIADRIFDKDLKKRVSRTITYGHILDQNEIVDEVLVSVFLAPSTYTREDVVEINCHGGVYNTRRILALCIQEGARLALPGEFTQRAFLNGRIDLSQAEAVNDLIRADSEFSHRAAVRELSGSVSRLLHPLLEDIVNVIAQIEVNVDYPEYEDVEEMTDHLLIPRLQDWISRLKEMIREAENNRFLTRGIKTVIVGAPNVGKSSLLNALLEQDKAIVTEIAGTTRDLVEGYVHLDGILLNLIDTAGIHETGNVIEKIGIEKSKKAIEEADLVILLLEAGKEESEEEKQLRKLCENRELIVCYNKNDLAEETRGLSISAKNGDIDELKKAIRDRFEEKMIVGNDVLNNERQTGLAKAALKSLENALLETQNGTEADLVSIDIQKAYTSLKEILGEVNREDLIEALFANFCLGK